MVYTRNAGAINYNNQLFKRNKHRSKIGWESWKQKAESKKMFAMWKKMCKVCEKVARGHCYLTGTYSETASQFYNLKVKKDQSSISLFFPITSIGKMFKFVYRLK